MSIDAFTSPDARGAGRYLQAILTHWKQIVALALLGSVSAAVFAYSVPKRYDASADILITPLQASDTTYQGFSLFRQSLDGSSTVVTAARVMQSPDIRHAAFAQLGSAGNGVSINVTPLQQADIVTISATARNAELAARAANAYAHVVIAQRTATFQQELQQRMRQLSQRLQAFPENQRNGNFAYGTLQQEFGLLRGAIDTADPTVRILTPATPPAAASWPRPKLSIALALLAALLIGIAFSVALEIVNPRVSREDELKLEQRLPILSRIPRLPSRSVHRYLSGTGRLPNDAWKGYDTLRAVLANAGAKQGLPRSVLVTSASPGDGKTMTAVNLAISLASAGKRVVLVDGDFHRPLIGTIFNVKARRDGFVRLLGGKAEVEEALVQAPTYPRLRLLLANRDESYSLGLLPADRFGAVISALEKECDVVVIDSPPVPEVVDALSLAQAAEVVLLSVRLGHTRRDKLDQLRELFGRRGIAPLGFVVTTRGRPERVSDYGYGYTSAPPESRRAPGQRAAAGANTLGLIEGAPD